MRLAVAMGRPHVDEMLDELTPEEWDEWQQFDECEGIGRAHLHLMLALIGSALASALSGKAIPLHFFMPWVGPDPSEFEPKPVEELMAKGRIAAEMAELTKQ